MKINYKGYEIMVAGERAEIYKDNELLFRAKANNFIWTEDAVIALVDLYIKFENL